MNDLSQMSEVYDKIHEKLDKVVAGLEALKKNGKFDSFYGGNKRKDKFEEAKKLEKGKKDRDDRQLFSESDLQDITSKL